MIFNIPDTEDQPVFLMNSRQYIVYAIDIHYNCDDMDRGSRELVRLFCLERVVRRRETSGSREGVSIAKCVFETCD